MKLFETFYQTASVKRAIKKLSFESFFKNLGRKCLARSRLTAIPSFASRFYLSQNFPASAPSRDSNLGSHPSPQKNIKKEPLQALF